MCWFDVCVGFVVVFLVDVWKIICVFVEMYLRYFECYYCYL